MLRHELLRCGQDLAAAGELENAEDLFFLSYKELEDFSSAADSQRWREIIAGRRPYDLEQHRRQIPRLLLSDGRAFYEGIQAPAGAEDVISGSPVSPGSMEGRVRVRIRTMPTCTRERSWSVRARILPGRRFS
ncbi:MAG: hypothetical protein ACYC6H_09690 [Bellilinea sp.]